MRKSNFKILALTAALIMPLSSCKETIIYVTPEDTPNDDIKTPIELSVGGVDGAVESSTTRAEKTENKTYLPFDRDAKVFILMQSEKEVNSNGNVVTHDGYEYKGDRVNTLYTVARGDVKVTSTDNTFVFDENNQRYWDDAHARSSQLTMWAIAQKVAEDQVDGKWKSITFRTYGATDDNTKPSIGESSNATYNTNNKIAWQGTTPIYPAIFSWSVGNPGSQQNANTLIYQDLLFSNNISYNKEKNWSDSRLKFNFSNKKFPATTELKFNHAMSKITILLKAGDGFKKDGTDFTLANNTIDKLVGINTQGLFNIKDGEFQLIHQHADITQIPCTSTNTANNPYYTLEALAIPNIHDFMLSQRTTERPDLKDENSRFVSGATNIMMEFTIDNNTFKIASDALFKALIGKSGATEKTDNGTYIPLEAGKNYIFTFVVGKTKIEHLTATVAEWENVEAESFVPVIDVTQEYGDATLGTAFDKIYTLLSSENKAGSYKNEMSATMTYNTIDNKYSMSKTLYWPDHKTHYFFRGVYPNIDTSTGHPTLDDTGKLINVSNCAYTKETSPSDLMIGIPRNADGSFDETCKVDGTGHKSSSAKGICATSGNINLNFRYAMSQVEVRLSTVTDDAAVNLTNAKVEIVNGYTNGTIALSDGGAAVTESTGNYELHTAPTGDNRDGVATTNIRHDAIVPQNLTNGTTTNLRFKITIYKAGGTTDIDDIYYADIKDINVTEGTSTTSKAITSWEAGKHYIYTLNLKKTEIKVSATITDWVTATGSTNVWF